MAQHLQHVSEMRMRLFRDFPYLYDAKLDDEREYMHTYSQAGSAALVVTRAEGQLIGLCTTIAISEEIDEFKTKFEALGYAPTKVLYLGEMLLEPAWQGRGLGGQMLERIEAEAAAKGYQWVTAAMVQREENDPRQPDNYRTPRTLLERCGYHAEPRLDSQLTWLEIGQSAPTEHLMRFWVKEI